MMLRTLIVGPGAIGTLPVARQTQVGHAVTVLTRGAALDVILRDGLVLDERDTGTVSRAASQTAQEISR